MNAVAEAVQLSSEQVQEGLAILQDPHISCIKRDLGHQMPLDKAVDNVLKGHQCLDSLRRWFASIGADDEHKRKDAIAACLRTMGFE